MRLLALAVALGACGPGLRSSTNVQADPSQALVAAISQRDVAAIEQQLATPLAYGGMYFADVDCMRTFPTPGVIEAPKRLAFAQCLATLLMTTSTRTDAMPGVAVLEYAPGVEIEAKFEDRGRGSTVTWIGYSGRRGMLDALPTVSPAVLESSRVEGDPAAEPSAEEAAVLAAEARARGESYSWAWMKVCLDAEGTITGVHAREASSELATAAFRAAIEKWRFKPFSLGTAPVPVCSLMRLSHPRTNDAEVLPVAFEIPEGKVRVPITQMKRISGETTIIPDDEDKVKMLGGGRVVGSFAFCVDEKGATNDIRMLDSTSLSRYDKKIMNGLAKWKFHPYVFDGKARAMCSAVTFVYSQH